MIEAHVIRVHEYLSIPSIEVISLSLKGLRAQRLIHRVPRLLLEGAKVVVVKLSAPDFVMTDSVRLQV
jgi:hypothetical protein